MTKPGQPYASVDWDNLHYLHSLSHTHVEPQPEAGAGEQRQPYLDLIYRQGIRHYAISNHGSNSRDADPVLEGRPVYPLSAYFPRVPGDLLGCPNAEHRWKCGPEWVNDPGFKGHFCGLGSVFNSRYRFEGTGITTWEEAFAAIIDGYVYDSGGGIAVNHCGNVDFIATALKKFPDDFLGLEICNWKRQEFYLTEWDLILSQGLQCFGFCNPDGFPQPDNLARNVLLVPRVTEEEAIKAYREGRFFGALKGTGLVFVEITMANRRVFARTNRTDSTVTFITSEGEYSHSGGSGVFACSAATRYVRVEAADREGERIYSQPVFCA